jgi:HlyD family secretion protein
VPSVDLYQARKKADSLKFSTQGATANVEESEGRIELLSNQLNSLRSITESRKILWEKAELDFNRTLIHSPINGVVLRLLASPGKRLMRQMDAPDSSTALIIFEADKLQARIDVPLADASKLSLNQKVEIVCSILPELKFEGILTRISGEADLQRNTLQVKVRILNPDDRLRPEMLCRAKFLLNTENSKSKNSANSLGVFVPFTLKPENNQSIKELWIIGADGRSAELRKVRFGKEINNEYISVISGLNAGDLIILNPPSSLKSGDRIKISKFQ